jgi:hypothetical protein
MITPSLLQLSSLHAQITNTKLERESLQSFQTHIKLLHRLLKHIGSECNDLVTDQGDIRINGEVEVGRIWDEVAKTAQAKSIVYPGLGVDLLMLSKRRKLLEATLQDLMNIHESTLRIFEYQLLCYD